MPRTSSMTLASSSSLLEERYQLETARAAGMLTSMMTSMMGGLTAAISTSLGYVNSYAMMPLTVESSLVDRQGAMPQENKLHTTTWQSATPSAVKWVLHKQF